jgi:hypothetical protein
MNDNTNKRADPSADLARLVHHLQQQGWQLIGACGRLLDVSVRGDSSDLDSALAKLREQAEADFAQAQEQLRGLHIPYEAMLTSLSQLNAMQDTLNHAEPSWLSVLLPHASPRLGLFQQKQERLQALELALAELRQAQVDYLALAREVIDESIRRFRLALDAKATLSGFSELYELWLTVGEAAYEQVLASEECSTALGRLANASCAVNRQMQEALDDVLQQLKLPTRRELITIQQRLHELRRRQRASERAVPAELDALKREMADLRAQVEQLRQPVEVTSAPAASRAIVRSRTKRRGDAH